MQFRPRKKKLHGQVPADSGGPTAEGRPNVPSVSARSSASRPQPASRSPPARRGLAGERLREDVEELPAEALRQAEVEARRDLGGGE